MNWARDPRTHLWLPSRLAPRRQQRGFIVNPYRYSQGGDPNFANVKLLLHCDGTDGSTTFTDSSSVARTVTPSGATVSTTAPLFGTGAALFDAAAERLTASSSADFNVFGGDCTIEFAMKFASATAGQTVLMLGSSNTNRANLSLSAGSILLFSNVGGSGGVRITATAPSVDTWHQVALNKTGSLLTLYVNGVSVGTSTTTVLPAGDLACWIASDQPIGGTQHYSGRLDEIRITKGVGRYTANYTPAGAAFPNS